MAYEKEKRLEAEIDQFRADRLKRDGKGTFRYLSPEGEYKYLVKKGAMVAKMGALGVEYLIKSPHTYEQAKQQLKDLNSYIAKREYAERQ